MAKKLEVNNLIISFRTNNGTVKAVRDISFDLEKGETLAIVGESGSGKSVTARAIMGILAKNAIPEGGEIIYDGQDLMKIDEEDFHKIRGNRISMIFQDPLSSLNPIVRIGKQLTEAMILNGKANQREAKRVYVAKTKLLRAEMKEAGVADVDAKFDVFDKVTAEGSKLEGDYNYSHERVESMLKNIEAVLIDSIDKEPKIVAKEMKLLKADEKNLYNPYLIDKSKSELPALMEAFNHAATEILEDNPDNRIGVALFSTGAWEMLPLDLGVDGALFAGPSSSPMGLHVNLLLLNPAVTSHAVGLLCLSVSSVDTSWLLMVCQVSCWAWGMELRMRRMVYTDGNAARVQ